MLRLFACAPDGIIDLRQCATCGYRALMNSTMALKMIAVMGLVDAGVISMPFPVASAIVGLAFLGALLYFARRLSGDE